MISSIELILSGILISVISISIGNFIGSKGSVKEGLCGERRTSCTSLLIEKIEELSKKIDLLNTSVNRLNGL